MDWHLSIAAILVIGASLVALLALGNRVAMARAVEATNRRYDRLNTQFSNARKAADDRQAHDGETISRLQNRIQQQNQLLSALQEDLDKFITQHRAMLDVRAHATSSTPPSAHDTAAVDQRERAIREKLKSMLHEFRAVTGESGDAELPRSKAA